MFSLTTINIAQTRCWIVPLHDLVFLISEFWTIRNTFIFIIPSDIPNVAICGSFFHFPKKTGGLIHVTMLCRSRSPIDRSATWQCNQNMSSRVNLSVIEHSQDTFVHFYLFLFTALLGDELVKHGSILLVDLLHLINVAGNLVHGFDSN